MALDAARKSVGVFAARVEGDALINYKMLKALSTGCSPIKEIPNQRKPDGNGSVPVAQVNSSDGA
jgi:hypothetical protein